MVGFLKSNYLILLVVLVVAIGVAAAASSGGNDAKSESVVASVSKVTSDGGVVSEKSKSGQAKTACSSNSDCWDDDAYCSYFKTCECYDSDEIYSSTLGCYDFWDDDLDDGVKVAAGIIITLAILIPVLIIGSIVACCCCCAGCAGHAWRQRRNQPPQTQVFVGAAYDQHGNPIQYGGPPPVYVQNPNNGPAPYPTQQPQQPQPHYENQSNNQKQNS